MSIPTKVGHRQFPRFRNYLEAIRMPLKVPKNYYDSTRPHLHQVIHPGSETVLDLGCGAGAFGQSLKKKANRIVWGVEQNRFLADRAGAVLDHVIRTKIETAIPQLPDSYFSTIVYDSLEREKHPHRMLTSLYRKLAPGGEILVSAMNLCQWPVIRRLIEGGWDYDYYGVMEKDHYRFFTQRTLKAVLENAGYRVVYLNSQFLHGNYSKVPEEVMAAFKASGLDVDALEEGIADFRYTVKGIRVHRVQEPDHLKGAKLLEKGLYEEARRLYLSLRERDGYSVETLYGLGLCSLKMRDFETAFKEFAFLLKLQPDYPPALNQMAFIHFCSGDLTTARSRLLEAIMGDPLNPTPRINYAHVLLALKEFKLAELVFENIEAAFPRALTKIKAGSALPSPNQNQTQSASRSQPITDVWAPVQVASPSGADTRHKRASQSKNGRFFVNSIAKGGTNLLTKILTLFPGIRHSNIVLSRGAHLEDLPLGGYGSLPVGRDGHLAKPSNWPQKTEVPVDADSPTMVNIEKLFFILTDIVPATFVAGHVPYSPELCSLFSRMQIKSFLILRDPRDVVVSHALFVSQNPYNEYFRLYRHLPVEDQIMTSIVGINETPGLDLKLLNIEERLESLLPWRSEPDTCTVFFENLVGPKGGGSSEKQLKELTKLADHLDMKPSPPELEALAQKVFGGTNTFRKGSIGSWRAHLTEKHKTAIKKLVGRQLIELGYEADESW